MDALACHLKQEVDGVPKLSDALIQKGMDALHFSLADMAEVEMFVAAARAATAKAEKTDEPLAVHFNEKERRERDPWRVTHQRLLAERKELAKASMTEIQAKFVDLAKGHLLTADEVLTATYLLWAIPDAQKFFAGIILSKRGLERTRAHNFFVAANVEASEAFLTAHGERLVNLAWPLFPPDARFSALNVALLFEADAAATATGGGRQRTPSVYRSVVPSDALGGGMLPVTQANDGSYGVDVTPIETAFNALRIAMEQQRGANRGRGGQQRGRGQQQQYQQPQQ